MVKTSSTSKQKDADGLPAGGGGGGGGGVVVVGGVGSLGLRLNREPRNAMNPLGNSDPQREQVEAPSATSL